MAVAHLGTAEVVSRSSFPCFGCSSGSSGCSCSLRGCDEMGNLDVSEGPGEEQRVVVGQGDDEEDVDEDVDEEEADDEEADDEADDEEADDEDDDEEDVDEEDDDEEDDEMFIFL